MNNLDVFRKNILPLTSEGVNLGNKIFGAAIIKKDDYSFDKCNECDFIFLNPMPNQTVLNKIYTVFRANIYTCITFYASFFFKNCFHITI